MLKILLLLTVLVLLLSCLRRFIRSGAGKEAQEKPRKEADKPRLESSKMVKCAYCELYIPVDEALKSEEQYFCSEHHRDRVERNSSR